LEKSELAYPPHADRIITTLALQRGSRTSTQRQWRQRARSSARWPRFSEAVGTIGTFALRQEQPIVAERVRRRSLCQRGRAARTGAAGTGATDRLRRDRAGWGSNRTRTSGGQLGTWGAGTGRASWPSAWTESRCTSPGRTTTRRGFSAS